MDGNYWDTYTKIKIDYDKRNKNLKLQKDLEVYTMLTCQL